METGIDCKKIIQTIRPEILLKYAVGRWPVISPHAIRCGLCVFLVFVVLQKLRNTKHTMNHKGKTEFGNIQRQRSLKIDTSLLASRAYNYSLYVNGKLIDTKQMMPAK
jgi:hypothetical protein